MKPAAANTRGLLAIATPVITALVWPVGVVLLWLSPNWRRRDKWIGTLILPGGLYLAWFIASGVRSGCLPAAEPGCTPPLAYQITHPTPWYGFNHVFGPLVLILLAVLPIASAIYLEVRLRKTLSR